MVLDFINLGCIIKGDGWNSTVYKWEVFCKKILGGGGGGGGGGAYSPGTKASVRPCLSATCTNMIIY